LPNSEERVELQRLEEFLKPRIEAANNGQLSSKSVDDIFNEVLEEKTDNATL